MTPPQKKIMYEALSICLVTGVINDIMFTSCRFLFIVSGSDPANADLLRAPMNGSLAPISIATTTNPVDLAVDVVLDRLVVVSSAGSLTTFSFDGQDLEPIASVGTEPVTGGAVFEDYVYVTQPAINSVIRYNKFHQREGGFEPFGVCMSKYWVSD